MSEQGTLRNTCSSSLFVSYVKLAELPQLFPDVFYYKDVKSLSQFGYQTTNKKESQKTQIYSNQNWQIQI